MDIHMPLLAIESAAGAVGGTMQRLGAPLRQPVQRKAGAPARCGREAARPFLVDSDDDLLRSNRHICFNPARARMTDNPGA